MCMHALGRLGEKMYNLLKKYNCNTIYHFTERKNLKSIKDVSVNSSLNYSTHSPRILKGVISMFQGSSLFQSSAV